MSNPPARTLIFPRAGAAAAVLTGSLALGACGSSSKPGTTAGLLDKALQEQVAGNLTQAEVDFKEVIRRDPKNKFAEYHLGLIYQTQGKTEEGNKEVQTAVNLDSSLRSKATAEGVPLTGS